MHRYKIGLPEIERGQQRRMCLAQQARQPNSALRPEAPSAAERHGAYPLGPHPAHQLYAPF
jgi:hypothetical protein